MRAWIHSISPKGYGLVKLEDGRTLAFARTGMLDGYSVGQEVTISIDYAPTRPYVESVAPAGANLFSVLQEAS